MLVVGKTAGYENQTTRLSTGAENVALYPKLKKDLQNQANLALQKELKANAIKDLSFKPAGSVLRIPDYRQQIAEARSTLPKSIQSEGNAAVAHINIEGIESKVLFGHSQVKSPYGSFIGEEKTEFNSLSLPIKDGKRIDRKADSEYKILSNLADQLGSNTQARGQITIFTERHVCKSCLGVTKQFQKRYLNINVNIFDNNGKVIEPTKGN